MEEQMETEPYEVVVKGRGLVLGHACLNCRVFHSAAIYICKWEDAIVASRESADECCNRKCEFCDTPIDRGGWTSCGECRTLRKRAEDVTAFNAAQKIPEAEYVGWLYFDNEYFRDDEELEDHCVQNDIEWPTWTWACKKVEFKVDAADIIENALQEHCEGASDQVKREDEEELQALLDTWCEKLGKRWQSWEEDRLRVVVLEPRELSDD
jgi:hypothetical protein